MRRPLSRQSDWSSPFEPGASSIEGRIGGKRLGASFVEKGICFDGRHDQVDQ